MGHMETDVSRKIPDDSWRVLMNKKIERLRKKAGELDSQISGLVKERFDIALTLSKHNIKKGIKKMDLPKRKDELSSALEKIKKIAIEDFNTVKRSVQIAAKKAQKHINKTVKKKSDINSGKKSNKARKKSKKR
jgi:hypothetical protein